MNWAVAIIEPNRDFEAARVLSRDGFRIAFLTYRKLLTGHRRPGWRQACDFVPRPLFPGYLFVELWPDQPWPRVHKAGFQGFVSALGQPLMLEDVRIECWKERVNAGEFDDRRPEPKAHGRAKFLPANSAEERRVLLADKFAEMLSEWAA